MEAVNTFQHFTRGIFIVFLLSMLSFMPNISEARQDPISLLERVTSDILTELKKNQKRISADPGSIYHLVDDKILPYVDFIEMARWIAGRNAWRKASQDTKDAFIKEFKTLVVRTYASALSNYTNEKIEFLPLRKEAGEATRLHISSNILKTNGETIQMDYRLVAHENSWRVYDIVIEGVSLLKGYQAQFSDQIRTQGLAAVVSDIKKHNKGA